MRDDAFFDTSILIYALAEEDPRALRAEELLAGGGVISVQVLNEFVSGARRKLQMSREEVTEALHAIRILCSSPIPITLRTHQAALEIAQQHGYGINDALIAAAAIEAKCSTLYSEDLDGLVIERLTIRNPFR